MPLLKFNERLQQPASEKEICDTYILLKTGADIHGININVVDKQGVTILHFATLNKDVEVVSLLLKQEIIDINAQDNLGRTALYFAITQQYIEIQAILLNAGANPSNILHIAAYHNQVEMVIGIKIISLYINFKNGHGKTPLHIAALRGQQTAVQILLENGAHINERDANGCTALDIAQKANHPEVTALLLKKGAKNGEGFVNAIGLYLYSHSRELQEKGYAFILMMTLFLSEITLIYLLYSNNDNGEEIPSMDHNALALPQNLTQQSVEPKIKAVDQTICTLKFHSDNVPVLECYDLKQEFLTHVFAKENGAETGSVESIPNSSIETALSIHVTAPFVAANEHELSGDIYDLNTCKQIEYFGRKALYCEGEKTNLFVSMVRKSDPLDISNMLNTVNSGLLLGLFGVLLVRFRYNEYMAIPENTDKKRGMLIPSENDQDVLDFFSCHIPKDIHKSESSAFSEDSIHSDGDDKSEEEISGFSDPIHARDADDSEHDPFQNLVVDTNDAVVKQFFKIAEEKLQQIEEMPPRIRNDEGPLWPLSIFFQPRNSGIKNSILFIRESLDDLKTERQIPKSDLYYIARDIYDLEIRTKSNETESISSTFIPLSTDTPLLPVIGFSP